MEQQDEKSTACSKDSSYVIAYITREPRKSVYHAEHEDPKRVIPEIYIHDKYPIQILPCDSTRIRILMAAKIITKVTHRMKNRLHHEKCLICYKIAHNKNKKMSEEESSSPSTRRELALLSWAGLVNRKGVILSNPLPQCKSPVPYNPRTSSSISVQLFSGHGEMLEEEEDGKDLLPHAPDI